MLILMAAAALAGQQIATADVASAVESEFAVRDLNGDGTLSRAEFGAWMAELRAKGAARTKADAPETRAWAIAAFAQADANGNAAVSEAELTGWLTTGLS